MMASMMPTKATFRFKDNITSTEIKMGMGIMTTWFISDPDVMTITALLQISDKKYALVLDSLQVNAYFVDKHRVQLTPTTETKKIAGFNCKKVMLTDTTGISYPVYYTDDIKLRNPNWGTPMKNIKGVLMEYPIVLNNIKMVLIANGVSAELNDSSVFKTPADYSKMATMKDMPEIFQSFFP